MEFDLAAWLAQPAVRGLDYWDRGVWADVLCLLYEGEERGRLTLEGRPMEGSELARVLKLPLEDTARSRGLNTTMSNLEGAGLLVRGSASGALEHPPMVEKEAMSEQATLVPPFQQRRNGGPPKPPPSSLSLPGMASTRLDRELGPRVDPDMKVGGQAREFLKARFPWITDEQLDLLRDEFVAYWLAQPERFGRKKDWQQLFISTVIKSRLVERWGRDEGMRSTREEQGQKVRPFDRGRKGAAPSRCRFCEFSDGNGGVPKCPLHPSH